MEKMHPLSKLFTRKAQGCAITVTFLVGLDFVDLGLFSSFIL